MRKRTLVILGALLMLIITAGAAYALGPRSFDTQAGEYDPARVRVAHDWGKDVNSVPTGYTSASITDGFEWANCTPDTRILVTATFDVTRLSGGPTGAVFIGSVIVNGATGASNTWPPQALYSTQDAGERGTVSTSFVYWCGTHGGGPLTMVPAVKATHADSYRIRGDHTNITFTEFSPASP